jgi:hypothetical protein
MAEILTSKLFLRSLRFRIVSAREGIFQVQRIIDQMGRSHLKLSISSCYTSVYAGSGPLLAPNRIGEPPTRLTG